MDSDRVDQRWNVASHPDRRRKASFSDPKDQNEHHFQASNLVEAYQALKHSYRNYDTRLALRRMQALRRSVQELNRQGYAVALELMGSINFGLVESSSDVDCVILHFCTDHLHDGECGLDCPSLNYKRDTLLTVLREKSTIGSFKIEFLDSLNLNYIEKKIEQGDLFNDEHIKRFMFYRLLGRPVNRPLITRYYEVLEENSELMDGFVRWAAEALSAYIKTSDHRHSFSKYNERIKNHQIRLPEHLITELRNYLDKSDSQKK